MRITYLHQYYNTPAMSGSTRSYEMARRLVAMGHSVNVITTWREQLEDTAWFVTEEEGICTHWVPIRYENKMGYQARILAFLKFAALSSIRAASIPADVVFATSTPLTIAIPGVYASRRLGVPLVFEVRDLWPEVPIALGALRNPALRWAAQRLERFAYANSRSIVALSPDMRAGVVRSGYPARDVTVIPNSSDVELFRPDQTLGLLFRQRHGISEDKILVVYAGTLGVVNDVRYLVRLACALRDDVRVQFLIVGDGVERDVVRSLAETTDCLGRNLYMMPAVPKCEVPAILAAADISISTVTPVPALEANSANKVFDAFAAGCCVAINHGGWLAKVLKESGAGIVLPPSVEHAASELSLWLADPQRIAAAGRSGRQLAETEFAREKLAGDLEQVLLDAVAAGP